MKVTQRLGRCLAASIVVLSLGSCTLLSPDPPAADIPVHELAVPPELVRSTPAVSYSEVLPAADGRQALIAGRSAEAGGPDRPTVWRSSKGSSWVQTPLAAPVDGDLVDLVSDGDAVAAVVAGTSWADGRRTAWVLRSVDGEVWEPVPLPGGVPTNPAVLGVAVTGGDAVLLVADTEGGWLAVRTGSAGGVSRLPEVGADVLRDGAIVHAAGEKVLVLARQGPRDGARPTVSYLSSGAGSSWAEPVEAMDATSGVTGTATDSDGVGLTATGWQRGSPGAPLRPAAWRSVDGVTWTAEPVPVPDWLAELVEDDDLTLTSPVAGFALLTLDEAPEVIVMTRSSTSGWLDLGLTDQADTLSPDAVLGEVGDRLVVAMSGRDAGVIGSMSLTGTWAEHAANGDPVDRPWVVAADGPVADPVLTTLTQEQTVSRERLGTRSQVVRHLLDPDGIGAVAPVPAHVDENGIVVEVAAATGGATVSLAPSAISQDSTLAWTGWHRSGPDAEPTTFTLPTQGGDWVTDAAGGTSGWFAVGETQGSRTFGADDRPAAWSSVDGTTWAPAELTLPTGLTSGSLDAVCESGDDSAIAVGTGAGDGVEVPLAYVTTAGGDWTPLDTAAVGGGAALHRCVATDAGVAVIGSAGGRDQVWEVDADGTFTSVRIVTQGERVDDVVPTPAGLVVIGTARENDWAGGVLDVRTPDGWTRVRVPAESMASVAALVGDQVQSYWQTPTGVVGYGVDLADLTVDR